MGYLGCMECSPHTHMKFLDKLRNLILIMINPEEKSRIRIILKDASSDQY